MFSNNLFDIYNATKQEVARTVALTTETGTHFEGTVFAGTDEWTLYIKLDIKS